jgi:hypothetical protein
MEITIIGNEPAAIKTWGVCKATPQPKKRKDGQGERVVKVDGGRNKVIIESWLEIGYDKLLVAGRVMG